MIDTNPDKLSEQIDTGVKIAVKKAIERHRRLGECISILKDGKVVTLNADQIPQSSQMEPDRERNQS